MPQLPRLLEVSPFPSLRDGYVLRKLDAPQRVPCPDAAEGSFTVEFEVVRRLSLDAAGRAGRIFTKPLKCIPEKNSNSGRWALKLNLQKARGLKAAIRNSAARMSGKKTLIRNAEPNQWK